MSSIQSDFLGAIIQSQYGDLVNKGSAILQKLVAGLADVQEAEAKSGTTRDNETTRRVTSGEGKTTTETTSKRVTTVDHIKQAAYLRDVVNPGIDKFAQGLLKGEIKVGKQTIELGEILGLVQELSKSSDRAAEEDFVIIMSEESPASPEEGKPSDHPA